MARPWRVALLAPAALARTAVAEEEPACLAGGQCEQEEVGMLQATAAKSTHSRVAAVAEEPAQLLALASQACTDDDAAAIAFGASHNVTVQGCIDAGPYCDHPDVAMDVWRLCCSSCTTHAAQTCSDNDAGAVVFGEVHNVTVRGCVDAGPYCDHPDVSTEVQAICCTTCGGHSDGTQAETLPAPAPGTASVSQTKARKRIKIRRATVRKEIDVGAVWDQLMGAVQIDQLGAMLKETATNAIKAKLKQKLDELKEAFPYADEIEEKFGPVWEDISKGVNIEELQSMIEEAKAKGAGQVVQELQAQLQEAAQNFDLEDVKQKAQEWWSESELSLPDLDDLTANFENFQDQAHVFWNDLTTSDEWGQAKDAVTGAASGVMDKMGSYFPGWWPR